MSQKYSFGYKWLLRGEGKDLVTFFVTFPS